jgi:15-cis-phytoene synthase
MARDTSFYYSFLVLPRDRRDAIIAVWDFCRAVDDAVDAETDERRAAEAIAGWRRELAACFDEHRPSTPQGLRLQPFIGRFRLPRRSFDDLIDGVEMDLGGRRYRTFEELHQYCRRVASAVGLISVEIFGYRDPRVRDYAVELGVALQLTNILRDVPVDLARGRLYLPIEDLERFACAEADVRAEQARAGQGIGSARVRALLAHQGARAREYYARARRALPPAEARRMVAAEIMGAIYRGILTRIERADYDVFSRVIRVPRPQRAWIAAATWARSLAGWR